MPNFTKNAIKTSFLKLLNQKPLSQITIKDIVEDCGINRNSFYYHYEDLPSLVREVITEETDRIIKEHSSIDTIEECLDVAVKFALDNKKAVLHIYNSLNSDILIKYLLNICEYVVKTFIDTAFPNAKVSKSDREIIVRYYKCECFGQIVEWLNEGMKTDITEQFHRLCELKKGMAEELFKRCTESNE